MKYPVRNRKIKHSKLIAFWASVLAVASVSSIGFSAWVLPSENTSQDVGNVDIEVGDINKYNWLTLDKVESFTIYDKGIINSGEGLFTDNPKISLYLTTDGKYTAEKRINIYGITALVSEYLSNYLVLDTNSSSDTYSYSVGYAIIKAGSTIPGYSPIEQDEGNFTTVASTTDRPIFKFKITVTFSTVDNIDYTSLFNLDNEYKSITVGYQASII